MRSRIGSPNGDLRSRWVIARFDHDFAVSAVVCFIIYFLLGFFGAARWGTDTNNNLLVNSWGPPAYQGILNILLGIYLALTNPPLVYPVAHVLRVST